MKKTIYTKRKLNTNQAKINGKYDVIFQKRVDGIAKLMEHEYAL